MRKIVHIVVYLTALAISGFVFAQESTLSLGGDPHDSSQPVSVTADNLQVDQASRTASFSGNAVVTQGNLALSADQIVVTYSEDNGNITEVNAMGNVSFTRENDRAQSEEANYVVATNLLVLSGNVNLKQGATIISGDTLRFNVETNLAKMSGNVATKFNPN